MQVETEPPLCFAQDLEWAYTAETVVILTVQVSYIYLLVTCSTVGWVVRRLYAAQAFRPAKYALCTYDLSNREGCSWRWLTSPGNRYACWS